MVYTALRRRTKADIVGHVGCRITGYVISDHVDWGQSCLSMRFTLWWEGCGLYRCAELRRSWCGVPRCRVSECTVRSMVSKYVCASHMRRGQLRMALKLLPWVAGRVFETFVAAQGESEMNSLAGRRPPASRLAVPGGHGMWNLIR
jgi:hypothetical protein